MREVSLIEFFHNRIFLETLGQSRRHTRALRQWWTHAGEVLLPRFSGEDTEGRGNFVLFFCFLTRKQKWGKNSWFKPCLLCCSSCSKESSIICFLLGISLIPFLWFVSTPFPAVPWAMTWSESSCLAAWWLFFSSCLGPCFASSTASSFCLYWHKTVPKSIVWGHNNGSSTPFQRQICLLLHWAVYAQYIPEVSMQHTVRVKHVTVPSSSLIEEGSMLLQQIRKTFANGSCILTLGSIHPYIWQFT